MLAFWAPVTYLVPKLPMIGTNLTCYHFTVQNCRCWKWGYLHRGSELPIILQFPAWILQALSQIVSHICALAGRNVRLE